MKICVGDAVQVMVEGRLVSGVACEPFDNVGDDSFSERWLMSKLFTSRARSKMGKLDKISGAVGGFVELVKIIAQAVRDRKKPKSVREIYRNNPSELEAIRREAGRTMVGTPERDEL